MKDMFKLIFSVLSWIFGLLFLVISLLLSLTGYYYVAALFISFSLLTIPKTRPLVINIITKIKRSPPIKILSIIKIQYIAAPIAILALVMMFVMMLNHTQSQDIDYFVKNKASIIENINNHYEKNELELAKKQIEIYHNAISTDSDLMNLSLKVEDKIKENSILSQIARTNEYDFNALTSLYDNLVKLQPKNNDYKSKYDYYSKNKDSLIKSSSDKWFAIVDNIKQKECKNETLTYNEANTALHDWYTQTTNQNIRIMKQAQAAGAYDVVDEYKRHNTEASMEVSARIKPYIANLTDCVNKNIKKLGYIVIPD